MSVTPGSNIDFSIIMNLLSSVSAKAIIVPTKYREAVLAVKKLLSDDISGLANSILDFSIECAMVDYKVQAESGAKTVLNDWLDNLNAPLSQQIPIGIAGLAKQYFRERWKGSSNLVLITRWSVVDGYKLPTVMYFVDGEDIEVKKKRRSEIGNNEYSIRVNKNPSDNVKIPQGKNEKIFVQKPYDSWSTVLPVPYIIRRGAYRNIKMLELVNSKGEIIASKALEYLLLLKKGDKDLAKTNRPEFVYDGKDLTDAKDGLKKVISDSKKKGGTPTYAANFDTDLSHLMPDYTKVITQSLYAPFEKRVLQGLGMIEVVEGTSSSRKESILNPKPLVSEVYSGINDFKQLLLNIIYTIQVENKVAHRKFSSTKVFMKDSTVSAFLTKDDKAILRGIYDRGSLSKETYTELSGDVDFEVQVQKRKEETKQGLDIIMYPPVTQNTEKDVTTDIDAPDKKKIDPDIEEKNENDNKDGVEKKNFTQSKYSKDDFPDEIKNFPVGARTIWIREFNCAFGEFGDEDSASQGALLAVKDKYKCTENGKWKKKTKAEISKGSADTNLDDLIKLKKLDVLEKQEKVLSKLDKEND